MTEDKPVRGVSQTSYWSAHCKDCEAEARSIKNKKGKKKKGAQKDPHPFQYSDAAATRDQELGRTRSDRCPYHRKAHRDAIRALAVPYVDLHVIGKVRDRINPSGPLGGLGPLSLEHLKDSVPSDLNTQDFGMTDEDILNILGGLAEKRVAVVEAGTGSGKSTFMPFRLMNPPPGATFHPLVNGPIVITEPRRAAATDVANFVANALCFGRDPKECKINEFVGPGFPVGYQVSGDRNWDRACDLRYVTDGTMINWIRDGSLAKLGMVIIDEAHERSANIDVILAQLREKLNQHPNLRIIITSATIDRDLFINYFGGDKEVFHYEVSSKKSYGYGVPFFLDLDDEDKCFESGLELKSDSEKLTFLPAAGEIPEQEGFPAYDLADATLAFSKLRCVEEIPVEDWRYKMEGAVARQVLAIAQGSEWGDILAFLPTENTINASITQIEGGLRDIGLDFDVYPLLRATGSKTARKATEARKMGAKRRIVVSSNLAETSLTVSGVRFIVDSGLICQSEWDPGIASKTMPIKPHSRAGVRQRWGRVGRDAPGWVFPLYTREQFLALRKDTPAEPSRTNLEAFLTRLAAAGVDPKPELLPAGFEHPDIVLDKAGQEGREVFVREVERARRSLLHSGLVDPQGDLTRAGKEVERYPGEASNAYAISLGDQLACAHEVALALATLGENALYGKKTSCILRLSDNWPDEWCARAAACHSALARGCSDDLDLIIRIAANYQDAPDKEEWCYTWWINRPALDKVIDATERTILGLAKAKKTDSMRTFNECISYRARAVLSRAFASTRYKLVGDGRYQSIEEPDLPAARLGAVSYGEESEFRIFFQRFKIANTYGFKDAPPRLILGHFVNFLPEAIADDSNALGSFDLVLAAHNSRKQTEEQSPGKNDPFALFRDRAPIGSIQNMNLVERADGDFDVRSGWRDSLPFGPPSSDLEANDQDSEFDPEGSPWIDGKKDEGMATEVSLENPRAIEINKDWLGNAGSDDSIYDNVANETPFAKESSSWPKVRISIPERYHQNLSKLYMGRPKEKGQGQGQIAVDNAKAEDNSNKAALLNGNLWVVSGYELEGEEAFLVVDPFDQNEDNLDPAISAAKELLDDVNVICCGEIPARETIYLKFWQKGSYRFFYVPKQFSVNIILFGESDENYSFPNSELPANIIERNISKKNKRSQFTISFGPSLGEGMLSMPTSAISVWRKEQDFAHAKICEVLDFESKIIAQTDYELAPFKFRPRFNFPASWAGMDSGIEAIPGAEILVSFELVPQSKREFKITDKKLKAFVRSSDSVLQIGIGETMELIAALDVKTARELLKFGSGYEWRQKVSELFDGSHRYKLKTVWTTREKSAEYREEIRQELVNLIDEYDSMDEEDWDGFGKEQFEECLEEMKEDSVNRKRSLIDDDRSWCFRAMPIAKNLTKNRIALNSGSNSSKRITRLEGWIEQDETFLEL